LNLRVIGRGSTFRILFIATGLLLLVLRPSDGILPMIGLLFGLVAFVPLGLLTGPRLLAVDCTSGRVTRAGSPVSLVRNLLIFAAQYGIAVALFRHPEAQTSLAAAGHAVSGASIGYFIGWTIAFRRRYRAAPTAAGSALEAAAARSQPSTASNPSSRPSPIPIEKR
jgi:membrane protein DedA with SNARE-associated domain